MARKQMPQELDKRNRLTLYVPNDVKDEFWEAVTKRMEQSNEKSFSKVIIDKVMSKREVK